MFRLALPCALVAFLAAVSQASAGALTDWTYGIATHYGGAQEGMNPVSSRFFLSSFFFQGVFFRGPEKKKLPTHSPFFSFQKKKKS